MEGHRGEGGGPWGNHGFPHAEGRSLLRLYGELADWWPLLSAPKDYEEEAAFVRGLLEGEDVRTVLELGSGGGNNASHLKARFELTLVDLSARMLDVSRDLNPECEHVRGDMRTVRLGREFDAVFVHDAVMYMTTEDDLRAAIETAHSHLRTGGVAVFVPDCVRETFEPGTRHGGHDGGGRGLRYVEWTYDPDPADDTYLVDFAYLLRDVDGAVRVVHDRHVDGLFGRDVWLGLFRDVGFEPVVVTDPWRRDVFVLTRRAA